jgi:hypothetical protein
LLAAKEAAGSRPVWWLEFGRITQWEGAVLRMSAGFSQISDAIKAGRLRESLSLSWWNKENRVLILPILISGRKIHIHFSWMFKIHYSQI